MKLQPNKGKILEAILFLIDEGEKGDSYVTQYEIVKALFVADEGHILKYGRPVTFDNYTAMQNGPVPSYAYDMLKPGYGGERVFGEKWPIWKLSKSPKDGRKAFKFYSLRRGPNLRKLSDSDQMELYEALRTVKSLKYGGVRNYTHLNPAYQKAWNGRGGLGSNDISYSELFNLPDEDLFTDIVHASKNA